MPAWHSPTHHNDATPHTPPHPTPPHPTPHRCNCAEALKANDLEAYQELLKQQQQGGAGVSSEEEQRFEVRAGLMLAWRGKALMVGCAAVCVGWVGGRRFAGNTQPKGGMHGVSSEEEQRFEMRAGLMLAWRGPVRAPCSKCLVYPPYGPRCLVRQNPTCHTSPTHLLPHRSSPSS